VGAGARVPVEQVAVCNGIPDPSRDSGLGAGAKTVGRLPLRKHTRQDATASGDETVSAGAWYEPSDDSPVIRPRNALRVTKNCPFNVSVPSPYLHLLSV
jgi:hypothetical protein